jgi:hypothetical protein
MGPCARRFLHPTFPAGREGDVTGARLLHRHH